MKILKILLVIIVVSIVPLILTGCYLPGISPVPPPGKGYLDIDSFPQGANVFINDKLVGQTPYRVNFSWQEGYIKFSKDLSLDIGIKPQMKIVLIKEGYFREEQTIRSIKDVILEQKGDRYPDIIPAKARVMFYLTKSLPVSAAEIPSTTETTSQQQQQMMGPTIIIGGKTVTGDEAVKVVNYGMVKFDSTPQGAEVLIEGNLIGYTPTSYLKFQVGTYDVEIIKTGYQPWKRKIMVIQDSSILINPKLEEKEK